jgi:hypothetical protein
VKIGGAEAIEAKAHFGNLSKVNKRCHKNVVILSDSRVAESLPLAA